MLSKLIVNGTLVDGTGVAPRRADVGIDGEKIVAIGELGKLRAHETIDAAGQYVAPGFIDIQNHSDVYWLLFDNPSAESMLAQGITTIAVGNCGASLAPILARDALLSIQKWHDLHGINVNWATVAEYLDVLSQQPLGVNVATLIGYSTLRRAILGDGTRQPTAAELEIFHRAIRTGLADGAFGVSSGLSYTHESGILAGEAARAGERGGGLRRAPVRSPAI